jgi:predicted small metal-binding protein
MTCPCGTVLSGDTEDELVEAAFAHLREQHPDMVDDYGREHILFMAIKVPKPAS